jgi:hypothetical protein
MVALCWITNGLAAFGDYKTAWLGKAPAVFQSQLLTIKAKTGL